MQSLILALTGNLVIVLLMYNVLHVGPSFLLAYQIYIHTTLNFVAGLIRITKDDETNVHIASLL